MEPTGPLVESNEKHQNKNSPFRVLDDIDDADEDEDIAPEHEMTGNRSWHPPQLY